MIGPSSEMLINLGARFTGCMREVPAISNVSFACLNDTSSICSLEDICGFGGFGPDGVPDQTFRFFTPLWLHVGVVHLIINSLVLLTSSRLVEKQMGTLKYVRLSKNSSNLPHQSNLSLQICHPLHRNRHLRFRPWRQLRTLGSGIHGCFWCHLRYPCSRLCRPLCTLDPI